jgi:hypothetical protein
MSRSLRGLSAHVAGALLSVGIVAACGGDDDRQIAPPSAEGAKGGVVAPPSGQGGRTSVPPVGSEGGEVGDVTEPGAPEIEVTSPEALDDPADGEVIVTSEVDVVCHVEKATLSGAMPVDKSSVTIDMLDADRNVVESMAAEPTEATDEYSAHFFLTAIKDNGSVSFRCSARDTSQPAKSASKTIHTFVDKGPAIQVVEPKPKSAHALMGAVRFEFDVTPAPVSEDDPGAEVDEVTLETNGVPIRVQTDDGETYHAFVDYADQDVFTDIPNGEVPVIIRATNVRSPAAAVRQEVYSFVVDGEGPVISIDSPQNEDVVGGQVQLRFSVTDELAGVDPDTVVIELNDKEYHYGEGGTWADSGNGNYVFLFDSVQAEKDSKIQATITIRATDEVGNMSEGESLIVYLDNVPPVIELDPGPVIETREMGTPPVRLCSFAFDPVGSLAANDLQTVLDVHRFRAMVTDRTNEAPGQNILYYAGHRLDSVYIYLQADPNEPLLIDGDHDGYCDELSETRNDLPFQHLNGVAPAGTSWFGPMGVKDVDPLPPGCEYQGLTAPQEMCDPFGNDMSRVVKWDVDSKIPIIFGIGNLERGPACTGTDWEIGQLVQEGWFCVAGRAEDNVGNVGISPPLRLCYDDGNGEPECDEADVPTCTDGCTPPTRFDGIRYMLP